MPLNNRKELALELAAHDLPVFPVHTPQGGECSCPDGAKCSHAGKHPRTKNGVKDATKDDDQIKEWWERWPESNIGIPTGSVSGIFVVDVDGADGKAALRALEAKYGKLPKTVTVKTGRGRHHYFRHDGMRIGNRAGHPGKNIDIRGDGGYVIAPGSVHASGSTYRFVKNRGLGQIEIASAPPWLLESVTASTATKPEIGPVKLIPVPAPQLDRARAYAEAARLQEVARVRRAPNHSRNNTLNVAAFRLGQLLPYDILSQGDVINDLAKAANEIGLDEAETQRTIASGLHAGRRNPRRPPFVKEHRSLQAVEPPGESPDEVTERLAKLGETDTDNAQRFAEWFGGKVIYTPGRGWLVYDGKRWRHDTLFCVNELAKATARLIAREAKYLEGDPATARGKFAKQALAKGALDRMLDLAKGLLAVEDAKLDADPWLLNVENGTINLRTGRREKHDPRDLLTKMAPVRANRKAKCPKFKNFLRRITGDDAGLRGFLQKRSDIH
jgi:putative DNA primase/helicase